MNLKAVIEGLLFVVGDDGLDLDEISKILEISKDETKELIKECQEIIEWYKADCGYKDLPTESVLTKINEVLR